MQAALVTMPTAYEELDAPEVCVMAELTHIRSHPWLEQMVVRATRVDPQGTPARQPEPQGSGYLVTVLHQRQPRAKSHEQTVGVQPGACGSVQYRPATSALDLKCQAHELWTSPMRASFRRSAR